MSPEQFAAVAAAVGTVLGGIVTAIIQWRKERRAKVVEVAPAEASAAHTVAEAAAMLVAPLREQVEQQAERIEQQEGRICSLSREVQRVRDENATLRRDRAALLRQIKATEAWIAEQMPELAADMPLLDGCTDHDC